MTRTLIFNCIGILNLGRNTHNSLGKSDAIKHKLKVLRASILSKLLISTNVSRVNRYIVSRLYRK